MGLGSKNSFHEKIFKKRDQAMRIRFTVNGIEHDTLSIDRRREVLEFTGKEFINGSSPENVYVVQV